MNNTLYDMDEMYSLPPVSALKRATYIGVLVLATFVLPLLLFLYVKPFSFVGQIFQFSSIISALLGVSAAFISFYLADPFGVRFNYSSDKRIQLVANIVARTTKQLIISTGRLDANVHSAPLVINAFRKIPEDAKIIVFHRQKALDEKSNELLTLLKQRNAQFLQWPSSKRALPNDFIISDMKHIRIEFFSRNMKDNGVNKFAIYFYNNAAMPRFYFRKYLKGLVELPKPIPIHSGTAAVA